MPSSFQSPHGWEDCLHGPQGCSWCGRPDILSLPAGAKLGDTCVHRLCSSLRDVFFSLCTVESPLSIHSTPARIHHCCADNTCKRDQGFDEARVPISGKERSAHARHRSSPVTRALGSQVCDALVGDLLIVLLPRIVPEEPPPDWQRNCMHMGGQLVARFG